MCTWKTFKALNTFLSYFSPGFGMVIDLKYIGFEIDEVFCCCEKVVGTVGFNQENQGPLEKSK